MTLQGPKASDLQELARSLGFGLTEKQLVELLNLVPIIHAHVIKRVFDIMQHIDICGLAERGSGIKRIKGGFDVIHTVEEVEHKRVVFAHLLVATVEA